MSFADDMNAAKAMVNRRRRAVFHESVFSAHRSIATGSPLTGSQGQPVLYGALRQSYQIEILSAVLARVASALKYARSIEDGVSYAHGGIPLTIRSAVGGTHSIQRTVLNFDRIVADATARVNRSPAFGGGEVAP